MVVKSYFLILRQWLRLECARPEAYLSFAMPGWRHLMESTTNAVKSRLEPTSWSDMSMRPCCILLSLRRTDDWEKEATALHWNRRRKLRGALRFPWVDIFHLSCAYMARYICAAIKAARDANLVYEVPTYGWNRENSSLYEECKS